MDIEKALQSLPPNATMRDIFDFCQVHNLHNLAQGMIELPPPKKLRERVAKMCLEQEGIHQYRNRFGEDIYRDSIAELLRRHYGVSQASRDSVLAISGVSGGIVSTLLILRSDKSPSPVRVGLMVPFYTYHLRQIMEVYGRPPVFISTNDDFTPNWANIESSLKDGLDVLLLCNPGNPQGNVWKKEDLQRLVKMTGEANCMLLIDEIYCDLVWKGKFYSPIQDELCEHVIVCRGISKTLAAQSWRIGYMVSNPKTIAKVMRVHDPIYISVSWQQHAVAEYLSLDYEDYVEHIKRTSELMQSNWRKLSVAFQKALGWEPIEPEGSMYGMFFHHMESDKAAVVEGLKKGVGVAPGNIFWPNTPDNTKYVRIHCGISAEKADSIVKVLEGST